jgi:uncharacterized protein (DUF934 family)
MALIKDNQIVADPFTYVPDGQPIPESGSVLVHLDAWCESKTELLGRGVSLGVQLKSDQSPELIAEDLSGLDLVALEFPAFRDGRAYSYARILRDRFGFMGEIRAVGDILMEQLHFMLRTGFDAFELASDDPIGDYRTALADFSVWYQPTGDGRPTAVQKRHIR